VKDRVQNMSLLILFFCVKNLRVEMGYEQIITIMKKKFFEPSCLANNLINNLIPVPKLVERALFSTTRRFA